MAILHDEDKVTIGAQIYHHRVVAKPRRVHEAAVGASYLLDFGQFVRPAGTRFLKVPKDVDALAADWHAVGEDVWTALAGVLDALPPDDLERLRAAVQTWIERAINDVQLSLPFESKESGS